MRCTGVGYGLRPAGCGCADWRSLWRAYTVTIVSNPSYGSSRNRRSDEGSAGGQLAMLCRFGGGAFYLGDLERAVWAMHKALEEAESLGPEHASLPATLNRLGVLYFYLGKYLGAEPLLQRAIALMNQAEGAEKPELARCTTTWAACTKPRGDSRKRNRPLTTPSPSGSGRWGLSIRTWRWPFRTWATCAPTKGGVRRRC